jgi:threonine dehydrogenase-like Zn-dependent dehydrogenase
VYAFEYETFFLNNVQLLGAVNPDWSEYLVKARDLFLQNSAALEKLVTHRFPVRDSFKAYSMYERHEDGILKAVLDISEW